MNFKVRIDIRTLCLLSAAVLTLYVLYDLRSLAALSSSQNTTRTLVQDRVVTKELIVTDSDGNARVRFGSNEQHAPALSLYSRSGQERGLLRLNQNEIPSLRLFDENGALRSGMGSAKTTLEPHLWFYDQDGTVMELLPAVNNKQTRLNPSASFGYYNIISVPDSPHDFQPSQTVETTIDWSDRTVPGK